MVHYLHYEEARFCDWAASTSTTKCEYVVVKEEPGSPFQESHQAITSWHLFSPILSARGKQPYLMFFFVCTKLIIVWSLPVVSIHCQFFLNEKGDTWIKPFNSNLMTLQTSTSLRLFVFLLLWFYTLSCYGSTTQQWIIGANRLLLF